MKRYCKQLHPAILWLWLGLVGCACPALGQAIPKQRLAESDYALWGQLYMGTLSPDGKYASWGMRYPDGRDTVFVGATAKKEKPLALPAAKPGLFFGAHSYACSDASGGITAYDLERGTFWRKENRHSCEVLEPHRRLLLARPLANGLHELLLTDYSGRELASFTGVRYWKASPKKTSIALTVQEGAFDRLLLLTGASLKPTEIASCPAGRMENAEWDPSGRYVGAAAPGTGGEKGMLFLYDSASGKRAAYDAGLDPEFPSSRNIYKASSVKLTVRSDGAVFFGTALQQKPPLADDRFVQVWSSADPLLYPAQRLLEASRQPWLACWNPASGSILHLGNSIAPSASVNGDRKFAISWDPNAYEPQFSRDSPCDYYLTDLRTGKKSLWLTRQPPGTVLPLAGSGLILYRAQGWNLYDPATGKSQKVSIPEHEPYSARAEQPASDPTGRWLLFHDGSDLWKYDTRNGNARRLTHGREKGLVYSLPAFGLRQVQLYGIRYLKSFDLSRPLVLGVRTADDSQQGYACLLPGGALKDIAMGPLRYSAIATDARATSFAFISESFASPPALSIVRQGRERLLFQSNTHQHKFAWGRAVLVRYEVGGQPASGILYVPDNLDPALRYPMVTHIYEKQSGQLHENILPSLYNKIGLNTANLVNSGYFVFLPDMVFGMGNPGADANRSVNAAIDKVLSDYPVNPDRLGIIGHSFGGYEVASILTLNRRFACAIAGAGIYDAVGYYLTANRNNLKPNYWRYEFDQERIGKSLYEDREAYLANSPVLQADKIATPVLIWAGDDDEQVPFEQSSRFHLALRRLGKQSTLLVYPQGKHAIFEQNGDRDLTRRVSQWFGHFLKGEQSEWIR